MPKIIPFRDDINYEPLLEQEKKKKPNVELYNIFYIFGENGLTDWEIFECAQKLGFTGYDCDTPDSNVRGKIWRWNNFVLKINSKGIKCTCGKIATCGFKKNEPIKCANHKDLKMIKVVEERIERKPKENGESKGKFFLDAEFGKRVYNLKQSSPLKNVIDNNYVKVDQYNKYKTNIDKDCNSDFSNGNTGDNGNFELEKEIEELMKMPENSVENKDISDFNDFLQFSDNSFDLFPGLDLQSIPENDFNFPDNLNNNFSDNLNDIDDVETFADNEKQQVANVEVVNINNTKDKENTEKKDTKKNEIVQKEIPEIVKRKYSEVQEFEESDFFFNKILKSLEDPTTSFEIPFLGNPLLNF